MWPLQVRCEPRHVVPGRQRYVVVARNLSSGGGQQDRTLTIRVQGVHPQYLAFPDLRKASEAQQSSSSAASSSSSSAAVDGGLGVSPSKAGAASLLSKPDGAVPSSQFEGELAFGICMRPLASAHASATFEGFKRPLRVTNLQATQREMTVTSNPCSSRPSDPPWSRPSDPPDVTVI